jgi:hypothetical protein
VNADILEHFVPAFRRTSMVERVTGSPWPTRGSPCRRTDLAGERA